MSRTSPLCIVKRNGNKQRFVLDKLMARVGKLTYGLQPYATADRVVTAAMSGDPSQRDGPLTSVELDEQVERVAYSLGNTRDRHDFAVLASRLRVSRLHKDTGKRFSVVFRSFCDRKRHTLHTEELRDALVFVNNHTDALNGAIVHDRDNDIPYDDLQRLIAHELHTSDGVVAERPQHRYMRLACFACNGDKDSAIKTYNELSSHFADGD